MSLFSQREERERMRRLEEQIAALANENKELRDEARRARDDQLSARGRDVGAAIDSLMVKSVQAMGELHERLVNVSAKALDAEESRKRSQAEWREKLRLERAARARLNLTAGRDGRGRLLRRRASAAAEANPECRVCQTGGAGCSSAEIMDHVAEGHYDQARQLALTPNSGHAH